MKKTDLISSNFLLYQTEDGSTRIDVKFENENVWLSQLAIAELYQTTKQNVSRHLLNSYNDGELDYGATVKEFLTVQQEGNRKINRPLAYYSLEAILAVGYRVKSHRGMQFRRWATEKLKELLQKGFVLDDYRLKEAKAFGRDYFDELLERIRDIRSSEKMFYRKITELYSLAVDYDPNAPITVEFYATVQNKLHYAVHGKTAAELISDRANAEKPNMGLTSWKGKKVRKTDVEVAKNYLNEQELKELNRIVTMYLDYAEDQAERQLPMYMRDWKEKLDAFLRFNGREILKNSGKVSHEVAQALAHKEYEKFRGKRIQLEDKTHDDVKQLDELTQHTTKLKRSLKRK
ncbi:MAG TPA: virulence RhuM family protein [Candidatus Cloacimonadota bacterium]|nr:virulence RhuM family protein [Candidatus Cloacimonadota bacterium]HPT70700.1 virulence RhuM family protein [Candidatus Cloacimonadota bacterium]